MACVGVPAEAPHRLISFFIPLIPSNQPGVNTAVLNSILRKQLTILAETNSFITILLRISVNSINSFFQVPSVHLNLLPAAPDNRMKFRDITKQSILE